MQRVTIFVVISIILLIAFNYYEPLRKSIFPGDNKAKSPISEKSASGKGGFDELKVELYAISNTVAYLEGRVQLLKIAQENRDWFEAEEYNQIPVLLAETEDNLKKATLEYEKIKDKYAQETVIKMVKESLKKNPPQQRIDSIE